MKNLPNKLPAIFSLLMMLMYPGIMNAAEEAREEIGRLLQQARQAVASLDAYTGRIRKRERFGRELKTQEFIFKFRHPFQVYIRYIQPCRGREAIFVKGKNRNRIKVHKGCFPDITTSIQPTGKLALKDNHHPIYHFGLGYLMELAARSFNTALEHDEGWFAPPEQTRLRDRPVWRIQADFPMAGQEIITEEYTSLADIAAQAGQDSYVLFHANPGLARLEELAPGTRLFIPRYYGKRAEIHLDRKTLLPVKISIWDWNDELYEEYEFRDLNLDPVLDDRDFDPDNPDYGF